MVMVLDSVFIPLHAADDEDHFAIAYAASHFRLGPVPAPNPAISSGSYVDAAIPRVVKRNFDAVRLSTRPIAARTPWSGRQVYVPLPASVYLPLVYLPQMIAIRIGEAAGLSVETTIYLARIFNGMTALALIAAAMAYLPETIGIFVLLLLSLPKSLQLFASNSADPVDHAITIAIIAFFCRAVASEWNPKPWHYAVASIGILMLGGVRPPLAAVGLLIFYVVFRRRSIPGMAFSALAMAMAVAWWAVVLPIYHDLRCQNAGSLVDKTVMFATHGPQMIGETLASRGTYYWGTFIGELGYGDARIGYLIPLPAWIYWAASAMLMLGVASLGSEKLRIEPLAKAVPAISAILVTAGIFFSLSIACTSFGRTVIEGVQGRYFVTPVLLLSIVVAALLPRLDFPTKLLRYALRFFLVGNFVVMAVAGINLYWRT